MNWKRADVDARTKLEMPPGLTPWQDTNPTLRGVPKHERYPILLDVGYFAFLKKEGLGKAVRAPNGRPRWFVDMSQGPDRAHWGPRPTGMIQNTVYYSYEFDIAFNVGWGHKLLGFPDVDRSQLSKANQKSLAGEAVDLPSQAIILYSIFLIPGAPWWRPLQKQSFKRNASPSPAPLPASVSKFKRRRMPPSFQK